jgi:hypothetical protein
MWILEQWAGQALSINIFMPLFSICYMSIGANGRPMSQHGRNKDFQDQTPMTVRLSRLSAGSRAASKKSSGGRAREWNFRVTGSGDQESEQQEA